jgi:hypothetical protein
MTNRAPRPEKQKTGSSTGLLIGLMLSFIIGLGILKESHQSYKDSFFPYGIGMGVILTSVVGYRIGAGIDDQNYRDECLGINRMITRQWRDEENWGIESSWKEYDDLEHHLVTTVLERELVTIFDGLVIMNHGESTSRSANRHHEEVKTEVVQRFKDGFLVK